MRAQLENVARKIRAAVSAPAGIRLPAELPAVVEDALGFRFVLRPDEREMAPTLLGREYDRALLGAMKRLIRPGDTVFDVGAHTGEVSVPMARLCGPKGKVFAFEPVAESCARMQDNLKLNDCANIHVEPTALGERSGTVQMNVFPAAYSGWNSLGRPVYAGADGVPVAASMPIDVMCTTLDEFCAARGILRIQFLKVDVEGYERDVFQGAARMLRERRIDFITFEISQIPLKGAGLTARETFAILEEHGYPSYRFDEQTERFVGPVKDSSDVWTNYFASWKDLSNHR